MSFIDAGRYGRPLIIEDRAGLARAVQLAEAVGAIGSAVLMRALLAGEIAYFPVHAETSARQIRQFTRCATRPAVMMLGDDDGLDRGPAGWPVAPRVLRWAATVMIHAAGAEKVHYQGAVDVAKAVRRLAIIECSSASLDDWLGLAAAAPSRPRIIVIRPRGGVHPLPADLGRLQ
jgi:hypothetical protein